MRSTAEISLLHGALRVFDDLIDNGTQGKGNAVGREPRWAFGSVFVAAPQTQEKRRGAGKTGEQGKVQRKMAKQKRKIALFGLRLSANIQ